MWLLASFACDQEPAVPSPPSAPPGPQPPPAWAAQTLEWEFDAPVAPYACSPAREVDFADWPGGARMYLSAGPFVVGDPPQLFVSGAEPGERIEVYAGALCALDCPQPDGGCFQAAAATRVAEWIADEDGTARGEVIPPVELIGEWVVIQATAPDAPERYVSQPVVDHTGPYPGPPIPYGILRVVGPATVRGLEAGFEGWTFFVPAGRRSQITLDLNGSLYFKSNYNDLFLTADGVTTRVGSPEFDVVYEAERTTPSRWTLWMGGTPDPYNYNVEFRWLPLATPAAWLRDADGDGAGEPADVVGTSTVPVPGATTVDGDCDDGDPTLHPFAPETCDDGIDQDCDGVDRPCEGLGPVGSNGTRVRGVAYAGLGATVGGADLDGDGVTELLAGSSPAQHAAAVAGGGFAEIDRTDGPPGGLTAFPPASFSTRPYGVHLDQDDEAELVLVNDVHVVSLYGDVTDRIPERSLSGVNLWVEGIAASDATGDGVPELFVSGWNGPWSAVTVFGDPLGAISVLDVRDFVTGGGPGSAADFDGDGIADWLDPSGCLWSGPLPYADWAWCEPVDHAVAGDVDGDGRADLVGAARAEVLVFPTPGEDPSEVVEVGFEPTQLQWLVDADAQGRPWVQASEATGAATYVVPLRGPGTWDMDGVMVWTGASVGAADYDGDGSMDLAIGRSTTVHAADPAAGEVWVSWGAFDLVR